MNIDHICDENEELIYKYYQATARELKKKIIKAALSNGDKAYLHKLLSETNKEISRLDAKFKYFSVEAVANAYRNGVEHTEESFKKLHINYDPANLGLYKTFGGIHKEAVAVAAENTYKHLSRVKEVIGRDCLEYLQRTNFLDSQKILMAMGKWVSSDEMRSIGITGVRGVVVGDETWQQAVLKLEKEFAKKDIFKLPYYTKKDGSIHRMVSAREYAMVVAVNTTAEAHRTGTKNRILDTFGDEDLVEIVGPMDEKTRSACAHAVGRIYSIEGRTKGYPTIAEYKSEGGFGINCRHDMAVTADVMDEYEKIEADVPLTKVQNFTPATSMPEAENWAKKNISDNVSFKGLDLQTANELNKALFNSQSKYPILKDKFKFIGEAHERNIFFKPILQNKILASLQKLNPNAPLAILEKHSQSQLNSLMRKLAVSKNTMALSCSIEEIAGITINKEFGKDANIFKNILEKNVAGSFHPEGCNTIKSVIDHEIGHQLDTLLNVSKNDIIKELYQSYKHNFKQLTADLSEYAWNNSNPRPIREFVAEAYSEYMNNPTPRPIARKVGELINELHSKQN